MNPLFPPRRPLLGLLLASALAVGPALPAAHAQKAGGGKKEASATSGGKRRVPADKELKELVRKTLLDVDKGLETKDFSQLYASLTPAWRRSISKEQLLGLYGEQIKEGQRTDYAATIDPVFDPAPTVDPRGVLVLSGHVPSEPQWVLFRVKYANEGGGWKPLGLAVRVQNSGQAPSRLPNPGEPEGPPAKPRDPNAPTPAPATGAAPVTPAEAGATPPGYVSPFGPAPTATPAPAVPPAPGASPR